MTDPLQFGTVGADRTYIEPITPEHVAAVLRKERPDVLLQTYREMSGNSLIFFHDLVL